MTEYDYEESLINHYMSSPSTLGSMLKLLMDYVLIEDSEFVLDYINVSSGKTQKIDVYNPSTASTWGGAAGKINILSVSIKYKWYDKGSIKGCYNSIINIQEHPLTVNEDTYYMVDGAHIFDFSCGSFQFDEIATLDKVIISFLTALEDFTGQSILEFDRDGIIL